MKLLNSNDMRIKPRRSLFDKNFWVGYFLLMCTVVSIFFIGHDVVLRLLYGVLVFTIIVVFVYIKEEKEEHRDRLVSLDTKIKDLSHRVSLLQGTISFLSSEADVKKIETFIRNIRKHVDQKEGVAQFYRNKDKNNE